MDLRIFDFEIYLTFLITFIIVSLFDGKSKFVFGGEIGGYGHFFIF